MDRNNFVSLIVNNVGDYTAAITRRVPTKVIKSYYTFFEQGEESQTIEQSNLQEIEWMYLTIKKEGEEYEFPELDGRLAEIKDRKSKEAIPKTPKLNPISEYNYSNQDNNFNFYGYSVNKDTVNFIVKQLVTCSVIVPNTAKIDIKKWAMNMPRIIESRFGKGDTGVKKFKEWANMYIEFLTWNIEDTDLTIQGLDKSEIQAIYAQDIIKVLSTLAKNDYINIYIEELEKYLVI